MAPIRQNLKCIQCKCTESLMWKQIGSNQQICHSCFEMNKTELESIAAAKNQDRKGHLRKSTRCTRLNLKNGTAQANTSNQQTTVAAAAPTATVTAVAANNKIGITRINARGRRNLNRRPPVRAVTTTCTTTHVKSLFHKGSYVQIGDIVSLQNANCDTFYAQIRGLIVDSFCEKSAVLTWLIPTQMSPPPNDQFDPSTYLIGPEEEQPRLLSCMNFVMHAPSDYYHNKTTPFPTLDSNGLYEFYKKDSKNGFIWTHLEALE